MMLLVAILVMAVLVEAVGQGRDNKWCKNIREGRRDREEGQDTKLKVKPDGFSKYSDYE